MKMQQGIIVPVCLLTVLLPLGAVHAGIYAASGEVTGVVTVTGTWTNVSEPAATQNTGAGMDLWSKTGYLMLDADPISGGSASSSFTHTYGSGSASLSTSVAGSPKTIDMAAEAEVHDVLAGEGYWSLAWAWDQVYMTCAQQTVTVTYDWSYALSTLLASPEDSSAYASSA